MREKGRNREAERLVVRAREKGSLFACACVCVCVGQLGRKETR